MRPRRQLFRRGFEYVAVQRIRLGNRHYIEAGDDVTGYRQYRMRKFYRRRQIGVKGSAWAEHQLKKWAERQEKYEKRVTAHEGDPVINGDGNVVVGDVTDKNDSIESTPDEVQEEEVE